MKPLERELLLGGHPELLANLDLPKVISQESACSPSTTDLFYSEEPNEIAQAKAICATCPVRAECLTWAVPNEDYGVWGGLDEVERRQLRAGAQLLSIEERRRIKEFRADLLSSKRAEEVAEVWHLTPRTIFRLRAAVVA